MRRTATLTTVWVLVSALALAGRAMAAAQGCTQYMIFIDGAPRSPSPSAWHGRPMPTNSSKGFAPATRHQ